MKLEGAKIVLNFPESLYWDSSAKYHNEVNKFVIGGVSPATVTGEEQYTVTDQNTLEKYIKNQKEFSNANYPDFVQLIKQLLDDGVLLIPNWRNKGINKTAYFSLFFFVKISISELDQSVPSGIAFYTEGETITWREWMNLTGQGFVFETPFHKYIAFSAQTSDEYKALLSHLNAGKDLNNFNVLSSTEFSKESSDWQSSIEEFPVIAEVQVTESVISVGVLNPVEGNTYKYNINGSNFNRSTDFSASAGDYTIQVKEVETGNLSKPITVTVS